MKNKINKPKITLEDISRQIDSKIDESVGSLAIITEKNFRLMDTKIDSLDQRLSQRIDALDQKIDFKFGQLENRIDDMVENKIELGFKN